MQFSAIKRQINTGMILAMCFATLASASQQRTQQRQQRQQKQRVSQRQERPEGKMAKHTRENIVRAMKREALATIKYRVFSEVARENGNSELADLFQKIAETESNEHLRQLFTLAKIVGSDIENLKHAIGDETYDSSLMYKSYAKKALQLGDIEAANLFEEMAKDESHHLEAFTKILNDMQG